MKIIQVVASLAEGAGVSSVVMSLDAMWRRQGYETVIYNQRLNVQAVNDPLFSEENIVIYHLALTVDPMLRYLKCRKILAFHNITDPRLFRERGLDELRMQAALGLCDVEETPQYFDAAITFSEYSRDVLLQKGWAADCVFVLPILIRWKQFRHVPDADVLERYRDGRTNILFTGRIFPSKRQEDVIRAFAAYRQYDATARLFLVGKVASEHYYQRLLRLVKALHVEQDVIFPGHVRFSEYLAYYQVADVFLCMSVHEGFCIPLVESMYFQLPIVALARTAVPDTLGGCGVLVDTAEPEVAAAVLHRLMTNAEERKRVLAGEAARLQELQADALEERYLDVLQKCRAIMEQEPLKYEEAQQDFSELPLPKGWGGGTPVVIYGMGAAGNRLFDMLRNDARVRVAALCDQGMGGKGQQMHGLVIEQPSEVLSRVRDAEYIISIQNRAIVVQVALMLHDAGVPSHHIHIYDEMGEKVI